MTPGVSPLLELFRAGDVDDGLRLLAARGGLMPQAGDDLALLTILTGDKDAQIARTARATLGTLNQEPGDGSATASAVEDPGESVEEPRESTRARVLTLGLAERVLLALRGSRAERAVLVTDPNRAVGLAVLSSPGMTESEVESIARMPQVHEDVLRAIASQRAWVRHYGVVVGLVRNPRTPAALSMNLLPRLQDRDLRFASTDRNIPDIVRVTARRKLVGA